MLSALAKSPGYAAASIFTLALGIGTAATLYSVADAVLFRPLPYKDPERLVMVRRDVPKRGLGDAPISTADFVDLQRGSTEVFEEMGAMQTATERTVFQAANGGPEEIHWAVATANFLELLGGPLALGHGFDRNPPLPSSSPGLLPVILSNEYWQRRFGSDPSIVGRVISSDHESLRLQAIGVLAPNFELVLPRRLQLERAPDVWLAMNPRTWTSDRSAGRLRVIARLKPGATVQQATEAGERVAEDLRAQYPLKGAGGDEFAPVPLDRYAVEEIRPALLALLGAGLVLFLIACANAVSLSLVRISSTEKERAVRAALGASRWRVLSPVLMESAILATAGAIFGALLASAAIPAMAHLAPAGFPRLHSVFFNAHSIVCAFAAGLVSFALLALASWLGAWRMDLAHLTAGRRASRGRAGLRVRSGIVVAQVTLSFVLLTGSGLLLRTALYLSRIDPGFDPQGVLTFNLSWAESKQPARVRMSLMHDALAGLAGVKAVTAARGLPFAGPTYTLRWGLPESGALLQNDADFQIVEPGYFEAMRTRLLQGRYFVKDDSPRVALIDDILAARAFPDGDAVGKRLRVNTQKDALEIAGVVAHQRLFSLAEVGRGQVFFPSTIDGGWLLEEWAVRASGDPAALVPSLRAEIQKLEPNSATARFTTLDALVSRSAGASRFALSLISALAAIAVTLATLGIYGVIAALVRSRTAEIGIRMAIGATPGNIFRNVQWRGLQLSLMGVAAGLMAALGTTRYLASLLSGVRPVDMGTLMGASAAFYVVAVCACWLPARRAARINPLAALKGD